jgi:hypothetical protein
MDVCVRNLVNGEPCGLKIKVRLIFQPSEISWDNLQKKNTSYKSKKIYLELILNAPLFQEMDITYKCSEAYF